jgi:hypothetical protein
MPKVKNNSVSRPDVPGSSIIGKSSNHTVQLIGYKGSGKTRFYLKEIERCAKIIYMEKTNEELNWLKHPSKDIIDEVSSHICMRVIDCDVEGVASLLNRSSIVPKQLIDNDYTFRKWKIRPAEGVSEFDMANEALLFYINDMKEHKAKYTNYNFARFIILENEGMLYNACRNHYIQTVDPSQELEDLPDLWLRSRKIQEKNKTFVTEFPQGPRETYGKGIYPLMIRYFKILTSFVDEFGFNVYSTVLLMDKIKDYGKPTQYNAIEPMGKPDLTQQFFEYILWLIKDVKREDDNLYNTEVAYWIDTAVYGKSRTTPDIITPNYGPESFWKLIYDVRKKEEEMWVKGESIDKIIMKKEEMK